MEKCSPNANVILRPLSLKSCVCGWRRCQQQLEQLLTLLPCNKLAGGLNTCKVPESAALVVTVVCNFLLTSDI